VREIPKGGDGADLALMPVNQGEFEIDVLACLRCGGRLRLIATVEDPREIREVLGPFALSAEPADRAPPAGKSFDENPISDACA
jgi:hypothetical protein